MNAESISLWRACTVLTLDEPTLALIIATIAKFEATWGRYPTPAEVQAQLSK